MRAIQNNSSTQNLNNSESNYQQSPEPKNNQQGSQYQGTYPNNSQLDNSAPPMANSSSVGGLLMTNQSQFVNQGQKLEPIYPKIIDSVQPLMYDTNFGSVSSGNVQKYKFQDKGMPVLINYRALQNKQRNQAIPVGILIDYFRQWIEIMKTQIDHIVNNLNLSASQYTEQALLHLFREILTYNQKYMKYIMLSIIPSREIHQNPTLGLVEQTLSRQNLKLTTCQHCYDFTLECENYIEKVLCTEKMQPKETIQKEIAEIKKKYKKFISDVECKQIFKKFTSILETNFLNKYSQQADEAKQIFNQFHEYRRQVGQFTQVSLLDTESYDREDALEVFSRYLPEGDSMSEGLIKIQTFNNPPLPKSIRQQAVDYNNALLEINQVLHNSMHSAPCIMLQSLEQLFASKFRLNMDSQSVNELINEQLQRNTRFLNTIKEKIQSFDEVFKEYIDVMQPEFEKQWKQLIETYDLEIGSFISRLLQSSPSQELQIDVEQSNLFKTLSEKGKVVEVLYLQLWEWFGENREKLEMENNLNDQDKDILSRELNFVTSIQQTSTNLRKGLYESKFLTADPLSLMESGGLEVQTKNIQEFQGNLINLQNQFSHLKRSNLLNKIFKELTVKDPLMAELLNPQMLEIINQVLTKPTLDAIKQKTQFKEKIEEDINSQQVKESTPEQLKERLNKLFRNLIFNELKVAFKYEDIPEMKAKLQKSILDFTNTDVQADLNEYFQKTVVVAFERLKQIKDYVGDFVYPDFENTFKTANHVNDTFEIYNQVIGKQNIHIKVQTLKDALETTYKYFFSLQNPPLTQIIQQLKPFFVELEANIENLTEFTKQNLKDFENLGKILNLQKDLLSSISNSYTQFLEQLSEWTLPPFESMADLLISLKAWFIHIHQKVFYAESKRKKQLMYLNTCEEKDMGDIIHDKVIKNKAFGIKGGMIKIEQDKLKQNLSPFKQEKWEIGVEWEQKPRPTKVLFDVFLPFNEFQCTVTMVDDQSNPIQVFDNIITNDNILKSSRVEFDVEIPDLYVPFQIQIRSKDQHQFQRINYDREVMISCLDKEVKLVLSELGLSFERQEDWKFYVKSTEKINWNPCIKVGAIRNSQDKGQVIEIIGEINQKQKQWENVKIDEVSVGSFTLSISNQNRDHVYYFVIECDGCEKDLPSNDHRVYVNGKTSQLTQSFSYSTPDTQGLRKEKPIWMLGYIKQKVYYKTGVFVSKSEVEDHLQISLKQQ